MLGTVLHSDLAFDRRLSGLALLVRWGYGPSGILGVLVVVLLILLLMGRI